MTEPVIPEEVAISVHGGMVCLHFDRPCEVAALNPELARNLSENMARAAYKLKFGDDPTTQGKSQITDQIRAKLVTRISVMLNSLAESPVDNKVKAASIVDQCLKEVS